MQQPIFCTGADPCHYHMLSGPLPACTWWLLTRLSAADPWPASEGSSIQAFSSRDPWFSVTETVGLTEGRRKTMCSGPRWILAQFKCFLQQVVECYVCLVWKTQTFSICQKIFALYEIQGHITMFTRPHHRTPSWANWIHSTPSYFSPVRS